MMENPLFLPPEEAGKLFAPAGDAAQKNMPQGQQGGSSDNPLFMDPTQAAKNLPGQQKAQPNVVDAVAPRTPDQRYGARPDAAPMELGDVGRQALQNLPRSATEFGEAIVHPFTHPKETVEALGKIGTGLYSKAKGAVGFDQDANKKAQDEAAVNAIGDFYKQRYGSWENAKRAIAEDPVGVLADASTIFTGGGGLAARLPGAVGRAGEIAGTVGRVTDPLNIALQVPKAAAKATSTAINFPAAIQSGAAFKSLQAAHEAGVTKNPTFWEHYSNPARAPELVDRVEGGIKNLKKEASDDWIRTMGGENATKSLNYDLVDKALADAKKMAYSNIDPRTGSGSGMGGVLEKTYKAIEDAVLDAKTNPNNAHTIADFDSLKQAIRNYGSEAARGDNKALEMMGKVANSAKETIVHPQFGASEKYAALMDRYGEAAEKARNLKDNLVAGRSDNTKLNKLLKGYKTGKNESFLEELYKRDPDLASAIAGHDLSTWMPSGLRGNIASSVLYGGYGALNPALLMHPGSLAHVALGSPKIAGGLSYGLGRGAALPSDIYNIAPYASQASRAGEIEQIANRPQRASGGRTGHDSKADALVRAAEMAKKDISKGTEALLDQPDETITRALAVAKKHI
jgi:hypothetical protein